MAGPGVSNGSLVCSIDIGGTFTDCVLVGEDGRMAYGKALSSPADTMSAPAPQENRQRSNARLELALIA